MGRTRAPWPALALITMSILPSHADTVLRGPRHHRARRTAHLPSRAIDELVIADGRKHGRTACQGGREPLPEVLLYDLRAAAFPGAYSPNVAVHVPARFDGTYAPGLVV